MVFHLIKYYLLGKKIVDVLHESLQEMCDVLEMTVSPWLLAFPQP